MRKIRETQSSIFDILPQHYIGFQYRTISSTLDRNPEIVRWIASDMGILYLKKTGREGLSAESILRAGIVKQQQQFSYEELAFHISDSETLRAFCRVGGQNVTKSALQRGIGKITGDTWEKINREILKVAKNDGVENGRIVRIDSTPIETNIHKPYDSTLLGDGVRVMTNLLDGLKKLNPDILFSNRMQATTRRLNEMWFGKKGLKKKQIYRQLMNYTSETLGSLEKAVTRLPAEISDSWFALVLQAEHFIPLVKQVMDQTRRRVFEGETVPEDEKIFSLFEVHTDIIVKGKRDIVYGHKVNLTTGKSGLILDLVVETGNPADSERTIPMIERQIEIWKKPPRQAALDGAYASKGNLADAKEIGVRDVMFNKKRGLKVADMAKSAWIYRKLRNFRAGVEANISCLKRAFGWTRCNWKGWDRFQAYTWSAAVAYNLTMLARRQEPKADPCFRTEPGS